MNRETKIGLVTGVTLIVLIGAMLSSYLSAPRNNVGDLSLTGQGMAMRNQLSNPVGIATVPAPQNQPVVSSQPAAIAPVPPPVVPTVSAPSVALAGQYNQITQLPYGTGNSTGSTASAAQTAPTINPEVVPVVVARQPAPAARTLPANATTVSQAATYTVRPGDTLGKIAWHFYHDAGPLAVRRIVDANRAELGSAGTMIRVGETLRIPAANEQTGPAPVQLMAMAAQSSGNAYGNTSSHQLVGTQRNSSVRLYRVQSGDTLWGIAEKTMGAGTDANVHRIMLLNHIRDARTIKVGQTLKIPS